METCGNFFKKILEILLTNPDECVITVLQQLVHLIQKGEVELFDVDLHSRTPIYEQLCKRVVEMVIKGQLKPADKLPSVRELAKELGVNPNTVSKAFQMLERDGIINSVPGRGSFISDSNEKVIKENAEEDFRKAVADAIKVGLTAEEMERIIGEMTQKKGE